jgi:hypothetical protein
MGTASSRLRKKLVFTPGSKLAGDGLKPPRESRRLPQVREANLGLFASLWTIARHISIGFGKGTAQH